MDGVVGSRNEASLSAASWLVEWMAALKSTGYVNATFARTEALPGFQITF
jgi:hypothetical protein